MQEALNILHWNMNGKCSLSSTKLELENLIEKYSLNFISINESHSTSLKISNFYHIECSPDLNLYVNKQTPFLLIDSINFMSCCELISIQIGQTLLVFCYLRSGKKSSGISYLMEYILELSQRFSKIVIIGDLNARLRLLGNRTSNAAGNYLQNFLDTYDQFMVLNEPDIITFRRPHPHLGSVSSIIDLCIMNEAALSLNPELLVLNQETLSDHYPLLLLCQQPKTDLSSTLYSALYPLRALNLHLKSIPAQFGHMVDDEIMYRLQANSSIQDTWETMKSGIYHVLKELKVIQAKRAQQHTSKLPQSILDLRFTDRQLFRQEARKFVYNRWTNFIDSINHEMESRLIWSKFKASRGRQRTKLTEGHPFYEVERIRKIFEDGSTPSSPFLHPEISFTVNVSEDTALDWNQKFTLNELNESLSKLGNSSPGPDGIPYNVLKALGLFSKNLLLDIMNALFETGDIPETMKHCLQIALPKNELGDFRPITLMNAIIKLYEQLIYNRIFSFIDLLLPVSQYGFRKKTSSYDQVARIVSAIESGRTRKNYVVVLFIDIKKAFDRVHRPCLIRDLHTAGIRGKILHAIESLVNGNKLRVFFEDCISSEYETSYGCPQGSILSPLLWNFYFRGYESQILNCSKFGFADDLAMLSESSSSEKAYSSLTTDFRRLLQWTQSLGIEISLSKTQVVDFSPTFRKKKLPPTSGVFFRDPLSGILSKIPRVSSYKYLGVILDENLKWKEWVNYICNQIANRITVIRRLSRTMHLNRQKIELFYNSYVRGYLNYASSIWMSLPATLLEKIIVMDRKGLRLCTGALPRTPLTELHAESSLLPLEQLGKRGIALHGVRCLFNPELNLLKSEIMEREHVSSLARLWLESWTHFDIPRAPNIEIVTLRIRTFYMAPVRYYNPFHGDFWKERLLARFRMQVLPTKTWAVSVRLSTTDTCRHCQQDPESTEHLLNYCPSLDYETMEPLKQLENYNGLFNLEKISVWLRSTQSSTRLMTEDAIFDFCKRNNLFKRD